MHIDRYGKLEDGGVRIYAYANDRDNDDGRHFAKVSIEAPTSPGVLLEAGYDDEDTALFVNAKALRCFAHVALCNRAFRGVFGLPDRDPKQPGRVLETDHTTGFSVSFDEGFVSLHLRALHNWRNDRGWSRCIFLAESLLGAFETSETVLREQDVLLPLPEGNYPAKAKLYEVRRRHSRLPAWFPSEKFRTVYIEVVGKPPSFPGKGENSWDCDDDAIYAQSSRSHSIEEAVGTYVGSVLRRRGLGYRAEYVGPRPETSESAPVVEGEPAPA